MSRLSEIRPMVAALQFSAWGLGSLSGLTGLHPQAARLPTALSLALAYQDLSPGNDPELMRRQFDKQKTLLSSRLDELSWALTSAEVDHLILDSDYDHETLVAPLSHKLAARRAGLGWIGKSSLLISPLYGPRLRLATVLLPAMSLPESTVLPNRCGRCRACVKACPYGAIQDVLWHPGLDREVLVDVQLCRRERAARPTKQGSCDPCALCMLACPAGRGADQGPAGLCADQ